jgi:hydrogenase maturation protein HypF
VVFLTRAFVSPDDHCERVRKQLRLSGVLQGIGFRPTVYRLASGLNLAGWVTNTTNGVVIEIEGSPERCARFIVDLPDATPFPGKIHDLQCADINPVGESAFVIRASIETERAVTPIPPDVATCPDCVRELFDPSNHRYLYPFITCTLCGPRFTVVRSFPYDRERTSMADFTMCPECLREYGAPADRRFHSQTNSCPECGPKLSLLDATGRPVSGDPISVVIELLGQGKIVAIKGVGGFHLACDALNEEAVRRMRERKGRAEKPFAVMARNLETARNYCRIDSTEEALLRSPIAPIVLLDGHGSHVAPSVAPGMRTLGLMLPYTPVHHLLFKRPDTPASELPEMLVMTSANRSDEPIVKGNDESLERLGDLADAFLVHNREIVLRADDSIFRIIAGAPTVFRRSRGLVPAGIDLRFQGREGTELTVLGAGGDIKNSLAIVKGRHATPGPHVGDLATPVGQEYFQTSIRVLTGYLDAQPDLVAADPHPEYYSNHLAQSLGHRIEYVFHHHAHAVSLLVEHGVKGPALFAVFDGTGYGTDGTIWGGEFLLADVRDFQRVGHFDLFPLPGGDAAIREPVRILAGLLSSESGLPEKFLPLFGELAGRVPYWLEAVRKGINAPATSSAGRLFDAAAAAAGFLRQVTFEGQAAMWLEGIADTSESSAYAPSFLSDDPIVVDTRQLIRDLCEDILSGTPKGIAAARFHNCVAGIGAETLLKLSERHGLTTVGLTGGCFQNRLLAERTKNFLDRNGLKVLTHRDVPPNDGGIALGQAVCARARFADGS